MPKKNTLNSSEFIRGSIPRQIMRFTTMTPFDQQIHFVEAMYDGFFGHDIIGSETHPLKKAFELYCEMMKEDEGRDEDEDSEDEDEDKDKDKDKKDGNELSFLSLAAGIINEVYRQQEEGQLLSQ